MPRKPPPGFANTTDVPVEKSRAEIEMLLQRHGAEGYHSGWQNATATEPGWDAIEFLWKNKTIRFKILRPTTAESVPKGVQNREHYLAQRARQRWRLLLLVIKAKLEAVEAGVAIFEEEFMAQIVTESGQTISEILLPRILNATNGRLRLETGRG